MKHTIKILSMVFFASFVFSACTTVPEGTVGSFNFVKSKDNKYRIIVINKKGETISLRDVIDEKKKASKVGLLPGQKENEVRLFFINGSCTVKVCVPFVPCEPVVIDDENQCRALGL